MKLSTLLVIVLLAAVAYLLSRPNPSSSAPASSSPAPPAAARTPEPQIQLGPRLQYTGILRQHRGDGSLLVHCGTRLRPDSGPQGDYVLEGDAQAAQLPDDTRFDFYARTAGITTYATVDGGNRTLTRLVFSNDNDVTPASPSPQGAWMRRKSALDHR